MAHDIKAILGADFAGSPMMGEPPLSLDPEPTGLTVEPRVIARLRDDPNLETIKGYEGAWFAGRCEDMEVDEKAPAAAWWAGVQYIISRLYYFAVGIPFFHTLFNGANRNNFVSRLGIWDVVGASGNSVTLSYDGVENPKSVTWYVSRENPDFTPNENPLYIFTNVRGCVQVNDHCEIENSVYSGRLSFSIVAISIDEGNAQFTITADKALPSIMSKLDEGAPVRIQIHRRAWVPEKWTEPPENLPLHCVFVEREIDVENFPEGGVFELLDLDDQECRIAVPKLGSVRGGVRYAPTVGVCFVIDGTRFDITSAVLSRFVVNQLEGGGYTTRLDLQDYVAHFEQAEKIIIRYWAEDSATPPTHGWGIGQSKCKHCKKVWAGAAAYSGYEGIVDGYYCDKRADDPPPSGLDRFKPRCYQVGYCDGFEENDAAFNFPRELEKLFYASNVALKQGIAGSSHHFNFTIEPIDHPSIGELLGLFRRETPAGYHPRTYFHLSDPLYGYFSGGAFLRGAFWLDDESVDWSAISPLKSAGEIAAARGILARRASGWATRFGLINYSDAIIDADDPQYQIRTQPYFVNRGYAPVTGAIAGDHGEDTAQRIGEVDDLAFAPAIDPTLGTATKRSFLQFGNWDELFNETTPELAVYTARLTVNTGREAWEAKAFNQPKVTGTVKSASLAEADVMIDCNLGLRQAGYLLAGERRDRVVQFVTGGNVVHADPFQPNNYYADGTRYGVQFDKAVAGDTIRFPNVAPIADKLFYIREATAYAGTAPTSGVIPVDQSRIDKIEVSKAGLPMIVDADGNEAIPFLKVMDNGGETTLYQVVMDASDGLKKYRRQLTSADWVNVDNALDTKTDDEIVDAGLAPPAQRTGTTAHSYRLKSNEYYATPYVVEGELKWAVFFGQENPFGAVRVYFDSTNYVPVAIYFADLPITDEHYNALMNVPDQSTESANGEYVGLYLYGHEGAASDGALVKLMRTTQLDARYWWTDGELKTRRNQFALFDFEGQKYLRLHTDYAGRYGEIKMQPPVPELDPDQFWLANIAPLGTGTYAQLDTDLRQWVSKPDRLLIVDDQGLLAPHAATLAGQTFEITTAGRMSPYYPVGVGIDEFMIGDGEFDPVDPENFEVLKADGRIYFVKAWVDAYLKAGARKTLRVSGRLAARDNPATARHFNQPMDALAVCDWVFTTGTGSGSYAKRWEIGWEIDYDWLPNPPYDTIWGSYWTDEIERDPPSPTMNVVYSACGDGEYGIAGQHGKSRGFQVLSVGGATLVFFRYAPDNLIIESAYIKFKLDGVKLTKYFHTHTADPTLTWDGSNWVYTPAQRSLSQDVIENAANVRILVGAKDKDGEVQMLGEKSAVVYATNGEWVFVEATDLIQSLYSSFCADWREFFFIPAPPDIDELGYPEVEDQTMWYHIAGPDVNAVVKEESVGDYLGQHIKPIRRPYGAIDEAPGWEFTGSWVNEKLEFTSFFVAGVAINFTLPNNFVDSRGLHYTNMPVMN